MNIHSNNLLEFKEKKKSGFSLVAKIQLVEKENEFCLALPDTRLELDRENGSSPIFFFF